MDVKEAMRVADSVPVFIAAENPKAEALCVLAQEHRSLKAEVERMRTVCLSVRDAWNAYKSSGRQDDEDELYRVIGLCNRSDLLDVPYVVSVLKQNRADDKRAIDNLKAEVERLREERREMKEAADTLRHYASETRTIWDRDEDAKVGKRLTALAGEMPGYSHVVDECLEVLKIEGES